MTTKDDPRRIGPYRVTGRLGEGGMGVVYAATDGPDRVAVKVIRPEYARDTEFRARFAREVRLLSRVQGACVTNVVAFDTEAARPWLATTYVPGPTLHDYVRGHGPLRGRELMAVAVGVAEALSAIHRDGVVHRDLKPSNVILAPDGPKVLDFGIARAVDETPITASSQLVGSVGWISPEQYRAQPATPASDIFTWGALVAFAATGRSPFGSGPTDVIAYRIMSEDPDLTGVPNQLYDLLLLALAKKSESRPSADHIVRVLGQISGVSHGVSAQVATRIIANSWNISTQQPGTTDHDPPEPAERALKVTLVTAGATCVAALTVLGFTLYPTHSTPPSQAATAALPENPPASQLPDQLDPSTTTPGALHVTGCQMTDGEGSCLLTLTAVGGPVNWRATDTSAELRIEGARAGNLVANQSTQLVVALDPPSVDCPTQGQGGVGFTPEASAFVNYNC